MIGIDQVQDRAVVAKQVLQKQHRFLVHLPAQPGKLRKRFLALVVILREVIDTQPLAGEFNRQPSSTWVSQHPPGLLDQHLG